MRPRASDTVGDPVRMVNFDQGLPDPEHFPLEILEQCLVDTLRDDGADALKYYGAGGTGEMQRGALGLRERLAEWVGRRDDLAIDAASVLLVHGSTDGLALAVRGLLGSGDGAVIEAATYRHLPNYLVAAGATVRTVPLDEHGMVVDRLDEALRTLRADGVHPKLIYTIPTFQAPTGTVLPLERRQRLLDVAREWGVTVLEDNCYYEFAYDEAPPPTLLALDQSGIVLQSDSFSKYVAPGLRMAWLVGAPDTVDALARARQDFAVSQLLARALERYVARGHLEAHLAELRVHYRHKRDLTSAALRRHCGEWVTFREPAGGFYFWLELSDAVDWDAARRLAAAEGIELRPADQFADDVSGRRYVRLSSIQVPDRDIDRGIATLGTVLRATAR